MSQMAVSEGRIMTAEQFALLSQDLQDKAGAIKEAEIIIAKAEEHARKIIEAVEAKAKQHEESLRKMSDESLRRFLKEDAVDLTAQALGNVLEQARQIRADLDQVHTWAVPMLRLAIKRVLGKEPEEDILSGAISQGLDEVRDRWDLVIRCHPALLEQLSGIVENDQRLQSAIREVQVDRSLTVEDIRLVTAQGVLDVGVDTQVETFLIALEKFLLEEENA